MQFDRFTQNKLKNSEINKKIGISKKSSKHASQNGVEREFEMDNLAKDSDGGGLDNVAYEMQGNDKINVNDYKFPEIPQHLR